MRVSVLVGVLVTAGLAVALCSSALRRTIPVKRLSHALAVAAKQQPWPTLRPPLMSRSVGYGSGSPSKTANAASCGSAITATRPMRSSVAGTIVRPPKRSARRAAASAFSTVK